MKKKTAFFAFFLLCLLINIIPLFIFWDKAHFSHVSIYAVIVMIGMSIHGVMAYIYRYKMNLLPYAKSSIIMMFWPDQDVTFTEKYKREFCWQFILYWSAIPFYIPCIFFITELIHFSLWIIGVVLAPQIVFLVHNIVEIAKDIKEKREVRLKHKQELEEQKKREEWGYYK